MVRASFAVLFLAFAPSLAAPQSIEETSIAFEDSLHGKNTEQLVSMIPAPIVHSDPVAMMRMAFLQVYLGRHTRNSHYFDEAVLGFRRLSDITSEPAWQDFGHAIIADAKAADRTGIVTLDALKKAVLGSSHNDNAAGHLAAALTHNRAFVPALVHVARNALASYKLGDVGAALVTLDSAHLPEHPLLASLAAQLELVRDSLPRAVSRLSIIDARNQHAPIVRYTNILIAFRAGASQRAWQMYQASVREAPTEIGRILVADIAALVDETDSLPDADSLIAFWESSAFVDGIGPARRVEEHYTRLHHARRYYSRQSSRVVPIKGALVYRRLSHSAEIDDRGVIYVRRGDPTNTISTHASAVGDNESWIYAAPEGKPASFHFAHPIESPDYVLISGITDCDDVDYYLDRARFDLLIARAYNACRSSPSDFRLSMLSIDRQARATSLIHARETKSATDRIELPFYYSVQTLKELNDTQPFVLTVVAVPVNRLRSLQTNDGAIYRFALTVTLTGGDHGGIGSQKDTIVELTAKTRLKPTDLIRVFVKVPAHPGNAVKHLVRIRDLNNPLAGRLYVAERSIPSFQPQVLAISDLVFARPETSGNGWLRDTLTLDIPPVQQFPRGRLGVYFELYNVTGGQVFDLEVDLVEKLALRRNRRLQLRFTDEVPQGSNEYHSVFKELKLNARAGTYRLRIKAIDRNSGRSLEAERELTVP